MVTIKVTNLFMKHLVLGSVAATLANNENSSVCRDVY